MFEYADSIIYKAEQSISQAVAYKGAVRVGIDLGTMYTAFVACDPKGQPIGCVLRQTNVVRDGLVLDYIGASRILKELKKELEDKISCSIERAAIAVPPGTAAANTKTHSYVVESAGLEVAAVEEEPTAANKVLQIQDGAIVDIGGGTTGISIFQNGRAVYTADEATGGIHFTYVIAGNLKISFEEAEALKIEPSNHREVFTIVVPVIEKVSSIINTHIRGWDVSQIVLCGGTSCLTGIEGIVEKRTGIKTYKPANPFLVTPLGIALSCPLLGE